MFCIHATGNVEMGLVTKEHERVRRQVQLNTCSNRNSETGDHLKDMSRVFTYMSVCGRRLKMIRFGWDALRIVGALIVTPAYIIRPCSSAPRTLESHEFLLAP